MNDNIEILLPNSNEIINFLKLSKKDQLRAITLGQKFLNVGNDQLQYWNNETFENKMSIMKIQHKHEIQKLKSHLNDEKNLKQILISSHKKENEILQQQIKGQIETIFKDRINNLSQKNIDINKKLERKIELIDTIRKNMYEEVTNKINEKETQWLHRLDETRTHYENLLFLERNKTEAQFLRNQNSTIKGQDGEDFTLHELNRLFPTAEIEDTHKQPNRGDFIIKMNNFQFIIENKNYTKNVPKYEINKFYKDVERNKDIHGGILISLKSGICSKDDFQLEICDGKPIVFLHNLLNNLDNITKAILILKIISNKDDIDLCNKEILDRLTNFSPELKRNLGKMKRSLKKHERDMLQCIVDQERIYKDIYALFKIK